MNIIKFSENFPNEQACILHFKKQRDPKRIVYPKCGCHEHYWLKNKLHYECRYCHWWKSLRSGMVALYYRTDFKFITYNRLLC